jgi:hypothetical protein
MAEGDHTVWTLQRMGRKFGAWHKIGFARPDPTDPGDILVYAKTLPIGGWTGFLRLRAPGKPEPGLPKNLKPADAAELCDDRPDDEDLIIDA